VTVREYVTVAEIGFAPYLLNLHASLIQHAGEFHLTVACADLDLVRLLDDLQLAHVSTLDVSAPADSDLLHARQTRTLGEYCWTLTPFLPGMVFDARPDVQEVTYIDADMWLRTSPDAIHDEFAVSGASCYITPHAFSPEWDASQSAGFYCVQYLPVRRVGSERILEVWQGECIARCSSIATGGGLGDQGYLNDWPQRYGSAVRVTATPQWFQGPWNCERFPYSEAISYHFHGLRLRDKGRVWLGTNPIPNPTYHFVYEPYLQELRRSVNTVVSRGFPLRFVKHPMTTQGRLASTGSRVGRWGKRVLPGLSQGF
jgi:hypothetical protein